MRSPQVAHFFFFLFFLMPPPPVTVRSLWVEIVASTPLVSTFLPLAGVAALIGLFRTLTSPFLTTAQGLLKCA
ncbi:hypothetical protein F4811DRAFT_524244 [Daldinia bambusicola]|nr:hypothetical protein F4811DRAFT_524244 [Daldinia bambusicola]